jgi:hypothetical protein
MQQMIPPGEYSALVDLYNSTDGNAWGIHTGWLDPTNSAWAGILVEGVQYDKQGNVVTPGNVTYLYLPGNRLCGTLPSTLGSLSQLLDLELWNNNLSGGIPSTLASCTQLEILDLHENMLSGYLPDFSVSPSFFELDIAYNCFDVSQGSQARLVLARMGNAGVGTVYLPQSTNCHPANCLPIDLAATSLAWNTSQGGVDFAYSVQGGSLATSATAALFWANGTTLASRISTVPVFTSIIPAGSIGSSPVIHLPGAFLVDAPAGTSTLLLALDPDNLISETDKSNNLKDLPDVTLRFSNPGRDSSRVSAASTTILKNLQRYAGQTTATITSVARTPEQQGQVMFNQAFKGKLARYKAPGQAVLAVYAQQTAGLTRAQILANEPAIVSAMVAKIYELGPSNVSKHCADPSVLNVVDIWPDDFPVPAQINFERAALSTPSISRFLGPFSIPAYQVPYDPVFHLEIPQTQPPTFAEDSGAPLAFTNGQAVVTGSVSTATNEFTYSASAGDTITLGVTVTAFRPGTAFNDDDSVVYLFDSSNNIVAMNDDDLDGGFQSVIENLTVSHADAYSVVVTTFGNTPLLDTNGILTGWSNGGESDIDFILFARLQPALWGPVIRPAQSGNIIVNWTNGVLQQASTCLGPWLDLPIAIPPLTIVPVSGMTFYRLRRQ